MAQSLTLLLVDDEVVITEMLHDALVDAGFSVITANNGDEATAILDDDTRPVGGLITDINMGDTADGWSVARHARELDPLIPVVYMTGGVAHEWAVNGVPKSVLIGKPFATAQIITAIAGLLNAAANPA
ncbi:MAG: response regulator [Janthinobacterium lividum]